MCDVEIKFGKPNREKLIEFLVEENDFSRDRVEKYIEKLEKTKSTQKSLF